MAERTIILMRGPNGEIEMQAEDGTVLEASKRFELIQQLLRSSGVPVKMGKVEQHAPERPDGVVQKHTSPNRQMNRHG